MSFTHLIVVLISCYVAISECNNNIHKDRYHRQPRRSSIDFCRNSLKFPPNCEAPNCTYQLKWRYRFHDDAMDFLVAFRPALNNSRQWTGVGFAKNKRHMHHIDAIICWPKDEQNTDYLIMDASLSYRSNDPVKDEDQNIHNTSADIQNGTYIYRFSRNSNTNDKMDVILRDMECPYLVIPVDGGPINPNDSSPITSKHQLLISNSPVCFHTCFNLDSEPAGPLEAFDRPQIPFSLLDKDHFEVSTFTDSLVSGKFNSPTEKYQEHGDSNM